MKYGQIISQRWPKIGEKCESKVDKTKPKIPNKTTAEWQKIINSAIESSINAIVITDINGKLTYVNNSFLKMWRYDDDQEVLGRRFVEFWQVKESVLKVIGALREKDSWAGELTARRKDGSAFDVQLSLNIIKDEADKSAGITVTIYDITERKRVEEALLESENKYRRFMESLADGCFVLDRNWRYIFVNESAAQLVKYTVSELLGNKITKLFPGIEDTPFFRAYQETMDTGKTNDIEAPFPRPDGTPGYHNVRVSAVPEGIVVVARDVTEHKQAEERIRLLSSVVEQSSEGIAVSDLKGNLLFVNDAFAAMHGYTREELIRKHLSIFHTLKQMPGVNASLRQIKETGEFSGEIWHLRRDGTSFPSLMHNSLLRDEAGNPIGIIGTLRDITDLKQAEESLRTSEEKWRSALENAPNVILIADREGTIQFINRTVSGFTIEETIGKKVYDYIPTGYHRIMTEAIKKVFQSGEPNRFEIEGYGPDGSTAWYETQIGPVKQNEHIVAAALITSDLTERKRAEEEIRRLGSAVKQSIDGIAMADLELKLIYVNDALARMHGYSPQEMIGMNVIDLHNEELRDKYKQEINQLIAQGSWIGEIENIRKDGTPFPTYLSGTVVKDNDGKPTGILAVVRDISERKRMEEALRESEENYRLLVENTAESISVFDRDGRILFLNRATAELLGGKPRDFIGKTIWDIFPHKFADERMAVISEVLRSGKGQTSEFSVPIQGVMHYFIASRQPIKDKSGEMKSVLILSTDITEYKRVEAELLQAQKQRLASVGQLATGIAHEINNPLMALSTEIQLLLGKTKDKELVESLELMHKFSRRIAGIVIDLMALSREISIDVRELLDINSLVERTLSLMEGRLESKKLEIKKKLDKNLPSLMVDKGQIQQVFTNILINSLDAMPEGGKLTISTKLSKTKDAVEIFFVDTGSGIAKENLPKVFDPFFTTNPPGKGVGLGLSVSYRIIENHGGSIRIDSELNKGTKVLVRLPVKGGKQ